MDREIVIVARDNHFITHTFEKLSLTCKNG